MSPLEFANKGLGRQLIQMSDEWQVMIPFNPVVELVAAGYDGALVR